MQNDKHYYQSRADFIEGVHIVITLLSIAAMFLVFSDTPLKVFSALWLCTMWIMWRIYGSCPLTVKEYELRVKAGEKVVAKNFIPRFFKKYFNLDIPDWMAEVWGGVCFVISVYQLLNMFWQ